MSATVDSLNIKIDASARGANQQLDKLVQKMIQLRSTVNGINVGNLNTMAASIQNFSKAASGLNQVKTSDFTRMAKGIEKLSNIRKGELNRAATAITNISKAFSGMGNVSDGATKIAQLAQGISRLGYKSTTQAIQNIPLLTKELKNMMSELSKASNVSNNVIAMTNAMANLGAQASGVRSLGSAMHSAGRSGNGFFGTMKKGISSIKNFTSSVRSATAHNRSFASTIGLLYAKFWALKRVLGAFGNAVKSSMDYIEEYNYFNVTMEKIASEWSDDFKKYGYENADAYGKSFQSRITEMMGKMTGFNMNQDGTLTDTGNKNLGLDITQMTNYAAGVAQVTNSVGLCGEASTITSKALSMLAGDMSSFRNLDMQTVMTNFSSGLIGQSRALYKYGIDITNATLATYANSMGIKKNISDMTQAEKMQLRMIAILDQSKVAWGDLAKTINSPSNQLRLLRNNFNALARTIGNIFLPVVAKVLPYINGLVIAIRRLFEWTASMLGIDLKDVIGNSGGGYSDAFEGIEDDADDASAAIGGVADSADKAAEAQKKLNKQLQGFDKLNNMTSSTTKGDSSSDKNNGNGDSKPIDLTSQLNAALADYEKVWNDAYNNMTNDAEKFADKLTKLFKNAWKSGDGSDIGSAVAAWLNKGIAWVNKNWSVADEQVQKIANILATAVNGFTYEFDWSGLGTAISKTLQTYLDGKTTFFDKTDWKALGTGIAKSLNAFIGQGGKGPIQSYFKSLGSELRAAIEFAFGAVTTFKFDNLGKAIGQGINDFLAKMGKVDKKTGLNGWQELAKTISGGIKGIATTITTALETVKWEDVGQAIADFIAGIDWGKVIWNFGKMVKSFKKALKRTLTGAGLNGTLADIVINVAIAGWIIKKFSKKSLRSAIGKAVGSKFSAKIGRVIVTIKKLLLGKVNATKLKSQISKNIGKIAVTIKDVVATVKQWKIADGSIKGLAKAIQEGFGLSGKTISIGDIATKLSLKVPSFVFPDPATDEVVRNLDEAFTSWYKTLPGYDESLGVYNFPKQLLIDFPIAIGDFIFKSNDEDNGKSKLQKAFEAFMTGGKGGTPSITALVKYLTDDSDVKKTNKKIRNKKVTLTYKGKRTNAFIKYARDYNSIHNKSATIKMLVNKSASLTNVLKNPLLSNIGRQRTLTQKINLDIAVLQNGNPADKSLANLLGNLAKGKKAGGGIFSGGSWHNIAKYAGGGLPGMGQMFIAREAGPELVGTIGGHTAVMNNNQIVASVSDGVFNALVPVLTSLVNAINTMASTSSNGNGDVYVQIDGDNIARAVRRSNSDYRKRTGKGMFD